MKRLRYLLIALLLLQVVPFCMESKAEVSPRATYSLSHDLALTVVFVGYDEPVVNTSLIDLNLQKNHQVSDENYIAYYNFNVSYQFANTSYYTGLKSHLLTNSVNGTATTSKLNTTALTIHQTTGERMSIFLPQSGRAINANAVEDWLVANPSTTTSSQSYIFYVMNFSDFDSADHELEHWYNTTELDFEAGYHRDFWRLEWDNTLNPAVKFPYACFTSQSRVFFIDTSAFQWYLTWTRIWWGLSVSGPKYRYYFEDLDEFQKTHDVTTDPGRANLAYYLAGWLDDALSNLLGSNLWTSIEIARAKSLSIQTMVLNNGSHLGYTNEAVSWILNTSFAEEAIMDLAPFIEVEVTVEFINLTSDPLLESFFDFAVLYKEEGWTYYNGAQIWNNLIAVRDSYFNFTAADIVINGFVFLEKNMSMMYGGGEYTGLGGSGQILVMKELGRYFQDDGFTPRSGLGLVFIHEAGHNLGFPHTFTHGVAYAGDFSFDVMGYYPYSYFFTQMRKDSFRRLVVDYQIMGLYEQLDEDLAIYNRKSPVALLDDRFDQLYAEINATLQLYDNSQYLEAYSTIESIEANEQDLRELIWTYICDFDNDGTVKIYDVVIASTAYGSTPGDDNWDSRVDLIQDNIIDIFDIVVLVNYYGKTWQ